ncbi:MAG: DNA cytosine methyltransferase [Comamonas sp.]|nr:DNA cytosine methyltransferase [Comamonas sp.]
MKIEAIDLFCGAGGLTRGLLDAGVSVRAGFDIESSCKFAYEYNNKSARFVEKSVVDISSQELENIWSPKGQSIRLLAGCAPCQPFSTAANTAPIKKSNGEDPRYFLLNEFSRLIRECQPELVTMENVPKVINHKPFIDFVETLKKQNYSVSYKIISCDKLGIPQTRKRLVLMASKMGDVDADLYKLNVDGKSITAGDVLDQLEPLNAGECSETDNVHFARNLSPINMERIRISKPGGSWADWPESIRLECHKKPSGATYPSVYSRIDPSKPAPTMTTQFYNFGAGRFGHPTQDRALTPREAAMIQSFPKNYQFVEKKDIGMEKIGKMIGNAVPPRLGEMIGKAFLNHLSENNITEKL